MTNTNEKCNAFSSKKRGVALLSAIVILVLLACLASFILFEDNYSDSNTFSNNDILYEVISEEDGTVKAIGTRGTKLHLPEEVKNNGKTYIVTTLGNTFQNLDIRSVIISNSITKIERSAFKGSNIEYIQFGSGLKEIAERTFQKTQLKEIRITGNIETIGKLAFAECETLGTVIMEYGVVNIGPSAFASSGISTLVLPDSLESLGENSFKDCPNLTSLTMPISLNVAVSPSNPAFDENTQLSELIVTPGTGIGFDYSPADQIYGRNNSILCTPWYMKRENITEISLCEGIVEIGEGMFAYMNALKKVKFPSTLESIGHASFSHCESLEAIDFSSCVNLKNIGAYAFSHCYPLEKLDIPQLDSIGNYSFMSTGVVKVLIGKVDTIGEAVFCRCDDLIQVRIESVKNLGTQIFWECYALSAVILCEVSELQLEKGLFYTVPDSVSLINHEGKKITIYKDETRSEPLEKYFLFDMSFGETKRVYLALEP